MRVRLARPSLPAPDLAPRSAACVYAAFRRAVISPIVPQEHHFLFGQASGPIMDLIKDPIKW
jgi:hypothetical protein